MSKWLKLAVIKAVEASGRTPITRVAHTVVRTAGNAVAGGAKIINHRLGGQNHSWEQAMKRLEEMAVACRGNDRAQLLRRWLSALHEAEMRSNASCEDNRSLQQTLSNEKVLFSGLGVCGEPINFRDLFLRSHALEGIIMSMILEAPKDIEVSLLLEIFGHSLTGGKEVHNAVMSCVQDLAKVFSYYEDEVLVKREELLQFAQDACSGLKLNADLERLETEFSKLQTNIDAMEVQMVPSDEDLNKTSKNTIFASVETLQEALEEVRVCYRFEDLLLKKKSISRDSLDIQYEKVDKLKVLSESLANSYSKGERRLLDHRQQKEEALKFRVAKAYEVVETEKELLSEIGGLEKQRAELESELKKVNTSLSSAMGRLTRTREERAQFDEASSDIVSHIRAKEDELSKFMASCKVEADVVRTWINFLEDTWKLQCSYMDLKEKQTNDELEKYQGLFPKLIKHHLSDCKEELRPAVDRIKAQANSLNKFSERPDMVWSFDTDTNRESNSKKYLEEEYLDAETKIKTAFSVASEMKDLFYTDEAKSSRRDDPEVKELLESIDKLKTEFDSIERPVLEIENHKDDKSYMSPSAAEKINSRSNALGSPTIGYATADEQSDAESDVEKLELLYGKVGKHCRISSIDDWDFD